MKGMTPRRLRRIAIGEGAAALAWLLAIGLPPSLILSPEDRQSYHLLHDAEYFACRAVGIAGVEPLEATAFMSLATHRGGGTAFKYLLLTGSNAGRIYALVSYPRSVASHASTPGASMEATVQTHSAVTAPVKTSIV